MLIDGKSRDLADGEGMTMEEIARTLGITRQRVWMILQSAYRKMRRNPRAIAILHAAAELAREQRKRIGPTLEERGID
jgi:predicted DNA-binding protein (UPF0251 family)